MKRIGAILVLVSAFALAGVPLARAAIERVVSRGGIEAWLIEDHANPLISVAIGFRGGAVSDPAGKEGLARLVSALLDEGAGDMDSDAFQGALSDLGIDFGFRADLDSLTGTMRTLTRHRVEAFRLLGLALAKPRFDAPAVTRVKGQLLSAIAGDEDDPDWLAGNAFLKLELGAHPYTRPIKGTARSLAAITATDLHEFAARRFGRDQMHISVVGDVTAAELGPLLDLTFGALPAKAAPIEVPTADVASPGGIAVVKMSLAQSIVDFGHAGIDRDDPDFYAAVLVDDVMGGGNFSSRLEDSLRERRGLVYSVETYLETLDHAALMGGTLATKNASVGQAIGLVREEWQRMHDEGPSVAELADAKTHVIGAFPLRFTSTHDAATALLGIQLDGLGIDYVDKRAGFFEKVDLADAKRVARRLCDPAALRFLVLGAPTDVKPTLAGPTPGE